MAVVLAGLYVLLTMHAAHHGGEATGYLAAFSLSALAIAAAKLLDRSEESGGVTGVMRFMGTLGFVVCLYLLTFEGATGALLRGAREPDGAWLMAAAYRWLIFALAIGAWGWLLPGAFSREGPRRVSLDEWLCPVTLIVSQVLALTGTTSDKLLGFLLFNLIGFCLASMWMVNGCKSGSLGRTVAGSLLLAALVFARFFDLFESLALRGLVFVVLGAVLFAEGFYYRKLRRESPGKENDQ
jgi:hypothetical protein